jgi:mannose-1-phosphate guanylyltransferase/mannose-6-phosphate isomerase
MTTLVPVLLAGGSGTRLWPTSRKSYPKQFIDLTGSGDSFLQSSLKRSIVMPNACPWIIVTGEDYRFLVAQQAKETAVSMGTILLEPSARNTAPAIALAAFEALELYDSPKLLVQTADHYIKDLDAFGKVIGQAFQSTAPFVLFGIQPTHPETGYGYIECGKALEEGFLVSSFTEKPDLETAEALIKTGRYLWNSGIFMLDAREYLDAIRSLQPLIYEACEKSHRMSSRDLDFKRVDKKNFEESPSISIDFALMEQAKGLHVIRYYGDWLDVGEWNSVSTLLDKDLDGNAIQGDGILLDSEDTFIRAESRLVTGIGLKNLVIVETGDAVLVSDIRKTQEIKELIAILNSQEKQEATQHQKVHRPWGFYQTLVAGTGFKVKQIVVDSGASISLQRHRLRSEHWVIVSGKAEVTLGTTITLLEENQSIYIPAGATHRVRNNEERQLRIIEVQCGHYLGEDDIQRLEDDFHRT